VDPLERLAKLFEKFPGIGPRQAGRFVQYLLRSAPSVRRELIESVRDLGSAVHQCPSCMRYSADKKGLCSICSDNRRDPALLAIIANDTDLLALERTHMYRGRYFVLGGLAPLVAERTDRLRTKELLSSIPLRSREGLTEIILAFPANPEGDTTAIRVREALLPLAEVHSLKISTLGRGLSTGSELEYADPDTLKSALDNRK
jgi:recombination protein RecR